MPEESEHFIKMFNIEISDVYAVQVENGWYRFQVIKVEDDNVVGIFIDLGMEWSVPKNNVMFLPPKFLKVPSQVKLIIFLIAYLKLKFILKCALGDQMFIDISIFCTVFRSSK